MTRFLHMLSVIFSWLSTCFPKAEGLYHARYALPHEVRDLISHLFEGTALLLGMSHLGGIYRVRATTERRELGNCLVVAPTRGGKGLLAVSQLLALKKSAVIYDPKAELYDQTAGFRATFSDVFRFDTRGQGHPFDPLEGKYTEDELYAVAKQLLYEPHEGDGKAFTQKGTKMLTLLFLAGRELNRLAGEEGCRLLPFVGKMADLGINSAAPVIHAISPTLARRLLDGAYNPEIDYDERKYLANSWESLTARLYPLLTEKVLRCFNGSSFSGKAIITAKRPVTAYLCFPEKDLLAKEPIVRLVLESLIGEMLETYDTAKGKGCSEAFILLDEAGTVELTSLPQYVATVAGRGISIWAAYQDLSQLERYGKKARAIINNMDTKIFYRQASLETARYVMEFLGYRSGYAHSQTLRQGQEASESLGEQAVPLITARDINELAPDEVIILHGNRKPLRGKRMDWQQHPLLVTRRNIEPPEVKPLPPLSEILLPSPWEQQGGRPRFPIDPDAIN